jgi:DNA-binding transcriptional regulator YiaG
VIEKKTKSYIFEGLGFPVILVNAPWKKVFGEWALDINFKNLQNDVLHALIHKPMPLNGQELRFIRKFLEMTTTKFGKLFGVTHGTVLKWENEQVRINPATELCIRLYIKDRQITKDKEFRKFYHEINIETLTKNRDINTEPIKINAADKLCAC